MKKTTAFWFGLACIIIGSFIGFLLSPAKNGVRIEFGNTYPNKGKSAE